jgi:hypothetical protein
MRKFIEEREKEVLLILVTMLAVTRWWIPSVTGFENIYPASQWVLSYNHGLIRRGLLGTIAKLWMPIVSIKDVHHTALAAYCIFLAMLLVVFYFLLKYKDYNGRLFRLILLFIAAPTTLSLYARDLGRFDIFLIMIMFFSLAILSFNKHIWLIPIVMIIGMFIHEGFLILCAPTIIAAMIFVYLWGKKEKKILTALIVSTISVAGAFLVLYKFGYPTLGYEEFSRLIQSQATFRVTELSMRECYYGFNDHAALTLPYLHDVGSIMNFFEALLILSPVIIILLNLWTHAFKNCGTHRGACRLFFFATLSGFMLLPIATDYGRWLSAIIFCNFFAIFFFVSKDIIKVEELAEYSDGSFPLLFVLILLTYLFFGPLHDWEPYPYQHNLIYSSLAMISVLFFDFGFIQRWRSANAEYRIHSQCQKQ